MGTTRQVFVLGFILSVGSGAMIAAADGLGSPKEQTTLTGDWFGHGQSMRDAGVDLRIEQSQFYQGLTRGSGSKDWQYGGKWDVLGRFDLAKWACGKACL